MLTKTYKVSKDDEEEGSFKDEDGVDKLFIDCCIDLSLCECERHQCHDNHHHKGLVCWSAVVGEGGG